MHNIQNHPSTVSALNKPLTDTFSHSPLKSHSYSWCYVRIPPSHSLRSPLPTLLTTPPHSLPPLLQPALPLPSPLPHPRHRPHHQFLRLPYLPLPIPHHAHLGRPRQLLQAERSRRRDGHRKRSVEECRQDGCAVSERGVCGWGGVFLSGAD